MSEGQGSVPQTIAEAVVQTDEERLAAAAEIAKSQTLAGLSP